MKLSLYKKIGEYVYILAFTMIQTTHINVSLEVVVSETIQTIKKKCH